METSPRHHQDNQSPQSLLPSPNSHSSSSSSNSNSSSTTATTNNAALNNNINYPPPLPSPKPISRSESTNPYPTTFVQADTSSFKQVVQMLTGSPKPTTIPPPPPSRSSDPSPKNHSIPPIKSIPKKNQSSGFKLYERETQSRTSKEKAIKERGFYFHPSPGSTPREAEPRLLPLFPVTSPRVSGSASPST
uniref:VQ domain-containing protein n=1 Tax=Salix viminalis TaxID=40686 RepID=A0A6N2KGS8_SALVM